jgi:hypothetical protein
MSISVTDCPVARLPELRAFFAKTYGPSHVLSSSDEFVRWQFARDSVGTCSVKVAFLDGVIVGCLGYITTDVSLSNRRVRGAWVVNWMVDADKRRLGLGPMLMREVTRQFDVTLNSGPAPDAQDLLARMRWTRFGDLARYVRVLDTAAADLLMDPPVEWPRIDIQPADRREQVQRVERFGEDATQLWNRFMVGRVAGACRSHEYLNWRYADHPVFEYRLFEARRQGVLIGLAVYRLEQALGPRVVIGRILEIIALDECGNGLLQALVDDARPHAALLDFFCSLPSHRSRMRAAGFAASEDGCIASIPIVFQPIDRRRTGIPFMADLTRTDADNLDWYVTKGDADQDRPNHLQAARSCDYTTSA